MLCLARGYLAPRVNSIARVWSAGKGFSNLHDDRAQFPSIDAYAKGKKLEAPQGGMKDLAALAAKQKESAFASLTFPCGFPLKIIGDNSPEFRDDVVSKLAAVVSCAPEKIKVSVKESTNLGGKAPSGSGRFISITAEPVFRSADEILKAYEVLRDDRRVKFVL